ncbi:unnamed protein product [Urochloa humidicola]
MFLCASPLSEAAEATAGTRAPRPAVPDVAAEQGWARLPRARRQRDVAAASGGGLEASMGGSWPAAEEQASRHRRMAGLLLLPLAVLLLPTAAVLVPVVRGIGPARALPPL